LHITLYYLNERLSENEKAQILIDTASLTLRRNAIPELASGYFGEPGKARVCYLGCPSNDKLEEINQFFAAKYDYSQIPENQLKFVPHISLFRISDPDAYEPHKDAVDALMNKELTAISCDSLVQGVYLFRVNSLFHPEIQIPIR
jgi:2'-5' RNA ligase